MVARVFSLGVTGIDGYLVTVEVDIGPGLPCFEIVGLPGAAVREARERVRAAITNSGYTFPVRRIIANLAPGDIPKAGALYDLPLAVGILAADGQVESGCLERWAFLGELSLDGGLRPVRGVLPMCLSLPALDLRAAAVPVGNVAEAAAVPGLEVGGFADLAGVGAALDSGRLPAFRPDADPGQAAEESHEGRPGQATSPAGDPTRSAAASPMAGSRAGGRQGDLTEVEGQAQAKRALIIAAAGGHNVLLVGPPGAGKTMLAERLPGILPPLTYAERLEISRVYSVAGLLTSGRGLVSSRPFRAPHHTATVAGLAGGGLPPVPGEFSLAHRGVLFLDELPEFRREALELLRQPLEEGAVRLARKGANIAYPSRFSLVAAMNPCPCGYLGDRRRSCRCTPAQLEVYRRRISGPLLDRIDMHVEVPRPDKSGRGGGEGPGLGPGRGRSGGGGAVANRRRSSGGPTTDEVRALVTEARERQAVRLRPAGLTTNAELGPSELKSADLVRLSPAARHLAEEAVFGIGLSLRARDRVIRLARTIADLEGSADVSEGHVAEALGHRGQ